MDQAAFGTDTVLHETFLTRPHQNQPLESHAHMPFCTLEVPLASSPYCTLIVSTPLSPPVT